MSDITCPLGENPASGGDVLGTIIGEANRILAHKLAIEAIRARCEEGLKNYYSGTAVAEHRTASHDILDILERHGL